MAIIEVTVCNVCRSLERETARAHLAIDGQVADLDLCAEHGESVRQLIHSAQQNAVSDAVKTTGRRPAKKTPAKKAATPRKTAGRRTSRSTTVEELEAMKASS